MVVFTCNHCGDSLQKPKVEKHYQTVCRSVKSLTCVDCFKDFKGEEFTAHTKCITEAERYAAKGTHTKPIVKKGEVKQESWTELVKSVVDNAGNVSASQKRVLDIISSSVNVPRKKNKFINFIKSSTGGRINEKDVESVWGMIEKQKLTQNASENVAPETPNEVEDKPKEENDTIDSPNTKPLKKKKERKDKDEHASNNSEPTMETTDTTVSKKKKQKSFGNDDAPAINNETDICPPKKKRKSKNNDVSVSNESNSVLKVTDAESTIKQPKSTKNNLSEDNTNVKDESNQPENIPKVNGEGSTKKKRKSKGHQDISATDELDDNNTEPAKKKHKSIDAVQEVNGESNESDNTKVNGDGCSKKKRKSKNNDELNSTLNEDVIAPVFNTEPTKKKRKSKIDEGDIPTNVNNSQANIELQPAVNGASVDNGVAEEPVVDFSFEQQILKILQSKDVVPLEKLQKKVLGAYSKKTGSEALPKTIKKFNKKLKKMSDVEIKDNNVRLK